MKTETNETKTGELGLPFSEIGAVAQSIAHVLIDRGHDPEQVKQLMLDKFDEDEFWERFGGPAADWLEEHLGLEPEKT